jgi:hypothetical protein
MKETSFFKPGSLLRVKYFDEIVEEANMGFEDFDDEFFLSDLYSSLKIEKSKFGIPTYLIDEEHKIRFGQGFVEIPFGTKGLFLLTTLETIVEEKLYCKVLFQEKEIWIEAEDLTLM